MQATETIRPVTYSQSREHLLQLEAFHRLFPNADVKLAEFDLDYVAQSLATEAEELVDDADYRLSYVVIEAGRIATLYWRIRASRTRNDEQTKAADDLTRHLREDVERFAATDAAWAGVARGWDESRKYAIEAEGV